MELRQKLLLRFELVKRRGPAAAKSDPACERTRLAIITALRIPAIDSIDCARLGGCDFAHRFFALYHGQPLDQVSGVTRPSDPSGPPRGHMTPIAKLMAASLRHWGPGHRSNVACTRDAAESSLAFDDPRWHADVRPELSLGALRGHARTLNSSMFQERDPAFLVDMFALREASFTARQHVVIASDPDIECGQ